MMTFDQDFYLKRIAGGLPAAGEHPRKVLVAGAGIAGLESPRYKGQVNNGALRG